MNALREELDRTAATPSRTEVADRVAALPRARLSEPVADTVRRLRDAAG